MKRFLALILAGVLVLGSMLSVTAANEAPTQDYETAEVIALLKYLNIITDSDGLTDNVTRADFATYAAKLIKIDTISAASKQNFPDVDSSMANAGAINALCELGYFAGGQDVAFRPYNNVRTNEALKVFMSMLGYKEVCEVKGGYPGGYINIASRIGLNKGIYNEFLTKGQLCALIYRTLTEPLYQTKLLGENGKMEFEKDEDVTILSSFHDIKYITGYVNTVGQLSIDMEDTVPEGKIRIEDKILRTNLIETDMVEYLGMNVRAYYCETETIEPTAVLVAPYAKKNNVISLAAEEVTDVRDAGSKFVFSYLTPEDEIKKIEIARGSIVIKNGESIVRDILNELQVEKGSYKFVDTNGDDEFDVVFVKEYYNIVVGSIEDKEGMVYIDTRPVSDISDSVYYRGKVGSKRAIYDKFTNDLNIDLTEDGKKVIKYKDASGKPIDLADIDKDEVISIYKSNSGNYIEICKGTGVITGVIEEIRQESATLYEIVVGGKTYKIEKNVVDNMSEGLKLGLKATFSLDCFGEIGAYVPTVEKEIKFAYVVGVEQNSRGFANATKIKMFTQDNVLDIFLCADRIEIDGSIYKDSADAYTALATHIKEPIRFAMDEDENLIFIDTLYNDESKEGKISLYQTLDYENRSKYTMYDSSFSNTQVYKSSTPVFFVPSDDALDDGSYAKEHFALKDFSSLGSDTPTPMVASFKVGPDGVYDDLLITKSGDKTKQLQHHDIYLIDEIKRGLDDEGNEAQYVYAYVDKTRKKIACSQECEDLSTYNLKRGDIVWFDTDSRGNIISLIDILVDVDENGSPECLVYTSSTGGEQVYAPKLGNLGAADKTPSTIESYLTLAYGYAGRVEEEVVCFAFDKTDALNRDYDFVRALGSKNIVVYDHEAGKDGSIYWGGADDIVSVENSFDDCSRVFLFMRNQMVKTFYVYK